MSPMTGRREFLLGLVACLAARPMPLFAQGSRVARIGFLGVSRAYEKQSKALISGLRELGWIEGKNYVMEYRWGDGNFASLRELAAALVRAKVDLLVTHRAH
jgi:putative tryptophan/tyrosine transport system substrate-binding protein